MLLFHNLCSALNRSQQVAQLFAFLSSPFSTRLFCIRPQLVRAQCAWTNSHYRHTIRTWRRLMVRGIALHSFCPLNVAQRDSNLSGARSASLLWDLMQIEGSPNWMNAAAHSSVCAGDRRPGRREMEVLYLYQALCVYAPAEQNLGQTVTQFGHYLPRGSLTFAARWWRRSTHTYTNSNASAAVKSHYAPLQLNWLCYNCRMFLRPKIKILRDGSFFCTEVTSRFFLRLLYMCCSLGECSAQALRK